MNESTMDHSSQSSADTEDADYLELKQSIQEIGQLVPIASARGQVLDGRKRLRACQELGKVPAIFEIQLNLDPEQNAMQLQRLNEVYTKAQITIFAAKLSTRPHGNRASWRDPNFLTHERLSQIFGISKSQIWLARMVMEQAIPQALQAVERGLIALNQGEHIARAPRVEQFRLLKEAIARPKTKAGKIRAYRKHLSEGGRPWQRNWAKAEIAGKAIAVLGFTAHELDAALEGLDTITDPERWYKDLTRIAAVVRAARETLKRRMTP